MGPRIKAASLDAIRVANGQPTLNEVQEAAVSEHDREAARFRAATPHLNSNQRRNLKKVLAKAAQKLD